MVEILQRLTVGFEIVVDEHARLRREAIFSHQMKFELEVSERAKGLEEHEPALALKVPPDEEDPDRIGVRHAWHWSTPFMHIHARGNDRDLVSRHFIIP